MIDVIEPELSPRGVRNNNPGNIRAGQSVHWVGQSGMDGLGFCIFDTPRDGFRAMAKILWTYKRHYGYATVAQIIERWAPPCENATQTYIAFVSEHIGKTSAIELRFPEDLVALCRAIAQYEQGGEYFTYADAQHGVDLATLDNERVST